jgi:hypothetical protein
VIADLRGVNAALEEYARRQHRPKHHVKYRIIDDRFVVIRSTGLVRVGRSYRNAFEAGVAALGAIRNSDLLKSDPPLALWLRPFKRPFWAPLTEHSH